MPKFWLARGERKAAANICVALWKVSGGGFLLVLIVAKAMTILKQPTQKTKQSVWRMWVETKRITFQMQKANCRKTYFLLVWG